MNDKISKTAFVSFSKAKTSQGLASKNETSSSNIETPNSEVISARNSKKTSNSNEIDKAVQHSEKENATKLRIKKSHFIELINNKISKTTIVSVSKAMTLQA